MIEFDNRKLRGRITEVLGTQSNFAKKMNLSERTISLKINGQIDFTQSEIVKAISILGIEEKDISEIFFRRKVQ